MTRQEKLDRMLPVVSGMACLVSAYTTQQGLATATSDLLVSVGVALAGGAFLFVFSLFLMWRFPYADRHHQLAYGAITVLVLVLAFGFSTQWSVIAMGGKDALSIHMQRVLDQADDIALGELRQASVEANLAPQLASLAQQYQDLASRETRGAFSGLRGEGSVVATLRNMSQMFGNLSRTVKGVDADKRALYDRYKELTAEARKVAAETEAADVSESDKIRRNNLAFSRILGEINEVDHAHARSLDGLLCARGQPEPRVADDDREGERFPGPEGRHRSPRRPQGRGREGGRPDSGGRAVEDDRAIQAFTMIPAARAIWVYKWDVFYAWAGGIAIDLIPTIFVILLTLGRSREEEERDRDAHAATQPVPVPRGVARAGSWPGGPS